jgi:hypothetical protein
MEALFFYFSNFNNFRLEFYPDKIGAGMTTEPLLMKP